MAQKTHLTPEERIKAAYMHYVLGVEQQAIAVAFEVNHGRVSEACTALKMVAEYPNMTRELLEDHLAMTNPER